MIGDLYTNLAATIEKAEKERIARLADEMRPALKKLFRQR